MKGAIDWIKNYSLHIIDKFNPVQDKGYSNDEIPTCRDCELL